MTTQLPAGPPDAVLARAAAQGDRAALAMIFDRYAAKLLGFCTSVLGNREEAADALQDTFVVAAQRLGQLRDPERLRPWLSRWHDTRRWLGSTDASARSPWTSYPMP